VLDRPPVYFGQDGGEGFQVPVDVADDGNIAEFGASNAACKT